MKYRDQRPPPPFAVGLIHLFVEDDTLMTYVVSMLQKGKDHEKPLAQFPGGVRLSYNDSLNTTVRKKMKEETHLTVIRMAVFMTVKKKNTEPKRFKGYHHQHWYFIPNVKGKLRTELLVVRRGRTEKRVLPPRKVALVDIFSELREGHKRTVVTLLEKLTHEVPAAMLFVNEDAKRSFIHAVEVAKSRIDDIQASMLAGQGKGPLPEA